MSHALCKNVSWQDEKTAHRNNSNKTIVKTISLNDRKIYAQVRWLKKALLSFGENGEMTKKLI